MSVAHKIPALRLVSIPVGAPEEAAERRSALDELNALHRTMSVHILRLEAQLEEVEADRVQTLLVSYMRSAIVLRDLLIRASGLPNVVPDAVPSFDQLLTEATLWAYRWAVTQLSEVRQLAAGQLKASARSIPLEALSVFHDLGELCASSGRLAGRQLVKTLQAIDDALYRLIETRDRIEHVIQSQRP